MEKRISLTYLGPSFVDPIIEFYHKPRIEQNQNKAGAVLIIQRGERERPCLTDLELGEEGHSHHENKGLYPVFYVFTSSFPG